MLVKLILTLMYFNTSWKMIFMRYSKINVYQNSPHSYDKNVINIVDW